MENILNEAEYKLFTKEVKKAILMELMEKNIISQSEYEFIIEYEYYKNIGGE